MDDIGILAFAASAILLVLSSAKLARRFALQPGEFFWLFLASAALQLGALSSVTSALGHLTPSAWLAAQVIVLVCCSFFRSRGDLHHPAITPSTIFSGSAFRNLGQHRLLTLALASVIVLSAIEQLRTSLLLDWDAKMYHASRVLYWIQNRSVFPFLTHDDRQVAFPFGSELFFLWPVLFTREEVIGRLIFWLGYPLSVAALYLLLRELAVKKGGALAGALVFATTPIVVASSVGLKPELWFSVFLLGAAFWAVRTQMCSEDTSRNALFSTLFFALATNVRPTALVLFPLIIILPLLGLSRISRESVLKASVLGIAAGALLSGLLITFGYNLKRDGNILGPESLRRTCSSDLSVRQVYTHAVRLPFLLLEFPAVPFPHVRERLGLLGNKLISELGAAEPLRLEVGQGWPGRFVYSVPEYATRFSLGGVIWLPVLLFGMGRLGKEFMATGTRARIGPMSVLVLLDAALVSGSVFLVRWMVHSRVPERFLVAPYALGMAIATAMVAHNIASRRWLARLLGVIVAILTCSSLALQVNRITQGPSSEPSLRGDSFENILKAIPIGSHILLVAGQNCTDYSLFAPWARYGNEVRSWGQLPFDSTRMKQEIENERITHVLINNDQLSPSIGADNMVVWLARNGNARETPVGDGMHLFEITNNRN